MKLVVACVARNEAHRYLRSALECWNDFADEVVLLDDCSEDGTAELAREAGAVVKVRDADAPRLWGAERAARAELYELAMSREPDWVFWLDADMCPSHDPRPHMEGAVGLAFRLYDLWSLDPLRYRCDGFWTAHDTHRPWAASAEILPEEAKWPDRGIHTGHMPLNLGLNGRHWRGLEPQHAMLLHYGYVDPEERVEKAASYLDLDELHPVERAHAVSITRNALLAPLPVAPDYVLSRG